MTHGGKGLKFQLGLSTVKAREEVKKFVKFANAEGKKVEIGVGVKKGGKSAAADGVKQAKKEAQDFTRLLQKAQSEIDRVSVKHGASLTNQVKRVEHTIKQAFAALQSGGLSERNFRRIVNSRIKALDDYGKAQERLDKDIARSKEKAEADAKRIDEQRVRHEKKRADAIERIRMDSAAELTKIEISRGVTDLKTRARFEQQLQQLLENSQGMQVEDVRRSVSVMMAEYRKLSLVSLQGQKGAARDEMARQNAAAKQMNRNVQMLFNVQQAVEDFSFAGMRGISNNLAWLATSLGGPGGIIALLGVMSLTLPEAAARMGLFGDSVADTSDDIKRQIDLYTDLLAAKRAFIASSRSDSGDIIKDPSGERRKIAGQKEDLGLLREDRRALDEDVRKLKRLEQLKGLLDGMVVTDPDQDVGEYLKELERLKKERNRIATEVANKHHDLPSADELKQNPEAAKSALEAKVKEADAEMSRAQQQIELAEKRYEAIMASGAAEAMKTFEKGFEAQVDPLAEEAESVENLREKYDAFAKEKEEALKREVEARKEAANRNMDDAIGRGDYDAVAREIRAANAELDAMKAKTDAEVEAARKLADAYGKIHSEAEKISDALDDMARNAERHIEKLKEEITDLRKESSESRGSFESNVHSAKAGIIDKQFDGKAEFLKNRDAAMLKGMFTGKKVKGLDEFISRRAEMIDAGVEQERNAALNRHMSQRVGTLRGKAAFQEQNNDFAGARGSLEEVQSLLMDRAGQVENPQEALRLLQQAEAVQQEIERLYQSEVEAKEREKAATEEQLEDIKEMQALVESIKETVENIDLFDDGSIERAQELNRQLRETLETLRQIAASGPLGEGVEVPEVPGFAKGGSVFKPKGSDTVPAMLTPGEFVVNAKSAKANAALLAQINAAKGAIYLARGGFSDRQRDLIAKMRERTGFDPEEYARNRKSDNDVTGWLGSMVSENRAFELARRREELQSRVALRGTIIGRQREFRADKVKQNMADYTAGLGSGLRDKAHSMGTPGVMGDHTAYLRRRREAELNRLQRRRQYFGAPSPDSGRKTMAEYRAEQRSKWDAYHQSQAGIQVPAPIQAGIASAGSVTTNKSVVSNVSNHFNVDRVVASGNGGKSIMGDLAREAKARSIRVA